MPMTMRIVQAGASKAMGKVLVQEHVPKVKVSRVPGLVERIVLRGFLGCIRVNNSKMQCNVIYMMVKISLFNIPF